MGHLSVLMGVDLGLMFGWNQHFRKDIPRMFLGLADFKIKEAFRVP